MFSFLKRKRGNLELALILLVSVGVSGGALLSMHRSALWSSNVRRSVSKMSIDATSAVETALLAYRIAEMKYTTLVSRCGAAHPFLQALKDGTGCQSNFHVFTPEDVSLGGDASGVIEIGGAIEYPSTSAGCEIRERSSSCPTPSSGTPLFKTKLATGEFSFYLTGVDLEKHTTQWNLIKEEGDARTTTRFELRTSLTNTVHIEGDGRVTQQNPDPVSKCPGKPWANYSLYDSELNRCLGFGRLGGGSGLAFYHKRYYGLRPSDGKIIELAQGNRSRGISSQNGFPCYDPNLLVNADDITLIEDQIYYVTRQGNTAVIGGLKATAPGACSQVKQTVCDLGRKGWGQGYEGIAALSSSDRLFFQGEALGSRFATFYLKTTGGDLLTALVMVNDQGAYDCHVYKDATLQHIEFKRTYGFERTSDAKPFYLY